VVHAGVGAIVSRFKTSGPVCYLLGYGQESDRQKSRAAGFQDHIVKPVDDEEGV
jgi:CheY-like chemotaxis protein